MIRPAMKRSFFLFKTHGLSSISTNSFSRHSSCVSSSVFTKHEHQLPRYKIVAPADLRAALTGPLSCQVQIVRMAGHSKWQNIRHTKAAKDSQKSQVISKMVQKLSIAIKEGGGSDPKYNYLMARVLEEAAEKNVPKVTLDSFLKKALVKKENSKPYTIDATGPGNCLFLIDVLTDNLRRTKMSVATVCNKHGGKIGDGRTSFHSFVRKGIIHVPVVDDDRPPIELDAVEELAIEAGAEEVSQETQDGEPAVWKFVCDSDDMYTVKKKLEEMNYKVSYASFEYLAIAFRQLKEAQSNQAAILFDKLDELEDVIRIYDNVEVD